MRIFGGANVQALSRIHFFVLDARGRTAAVQPSHDGWAVYGDEAMPVRALTNSSYPDLLDALSGYVGFGGVVPLPFRTEIAHPGSVERFVLAAAASQNDMPVTT